MDRSCWVGENQALFRQSERDRSIGLLRRNWGRLCVSRSGKEQQSRRQSWKEVGNDAETRTASEEVGTEAGCKDREQNPHKSR